MTAIRDLRHVITRAGRQFRVSLANRGLASTLYWAAFGYLRPNRFAILARDLSAPSRSFEPPTGMRIELWPASKLRAWRNGREGLSPEYFQDVVDGVSTVSVAVADDDVIGLIWMYRPEDSGRMFSLRRGETELNYGYVRRPYRGRGIFSALIDAACDRLREERFAVTYATVHSENPPSLRAFRRVGFSEVGEGVRVFLFPPRIRWSEAAEKSARLRPSLV